ncbi:hypothetical protein SO802_012757 [Lithocarpus litseifolius]|uniref:Uncharacterized protein n=1 Tax=Lithocarpus litseifolius TaxID=425828 RepID=A0AAW2D944_9ROSI
MDVDGVLALINSTKLVIRGEFGQDSKEGRLQRERMPDIQASSSSSKPVTPIILLKSSSIEDTRQFKPQEEVPSTMVKEGEHPNPEEPTNTQVLLNTMVASQIQLRENMNRMMQQFQNLKSNQEKDKTRLDVESEKKINESRNKMEEMIRRARKMEDLMDYDSLSLFPNARLPPKFKMPTLDKFDGFSCPKSHLKMYMRASSP